jgi:hypothetical protein
LNYLVVLIHFDNKRGDYEGENLLDWYLSLFVLKFRTRLGKGRNWGWDWLWGSLGLRRQ